MKKQILLIAFSIFMTASAHSELPDFSSVWKRIQLNEYQEAVEDLESIVEVNRKPEGYHWEQSHSDQSGRDVEEWLHGYLIKFYIAYKSNDQKEMKSQSQNIHQLSYLEFMGKHPISN